MQKAPAATLCACRGFVASKCCSLLAGRNLKRLQEDGKLPSRAACDSLVIAALSALRCRASCSRCRRRMRRAQHGRSTSRRRSPGALFLISGHGYGHGVGMGQWGAQGYALQGYTYDQILDAYYPGTTLGQTTAKSDPRAPREREEEADRLVEEADRRRGRRRHRPHAPRRQHEAHAGAEARGRRRACTGSRSTAHLLAGGGTTLTLGGAYRGKIVVDVPSKKLRAINVVGAPAVPRRRRHGGDAVGLAARRAPGAGGRLALVRARGPEGRSAVRRLGRRASRTSASPPRRRPGRRPWTRRKGEVLHYNGNVATTVYSSSTGGWTQSAADAWGGGRPYLVSVQGSVRHDLAVPQLGAGSRHGEDARRGARSRGQRDRRDGEPQRVEAREDARGHVARARHAAHGHSRRRHGSPPRSACARRGSASASLAPAAVAERRVSPGTR